MTTSRTFRLATVVVAFLLMAACGDESTILEESGQDLDIAGQALNFEGPKKATFEIGQPQSVSYYAVHSTGHDFDLDVIAPSGASVSVTEQGAFKKRVTVDWNPAHDAEGTLHPVSLRASTGSSEWAGEFYIYVALTESDGWVPPDVDDDELFFENKAVGTRK